MEAVERLVEVRPRGGPGTAYAVRIGAGAPSALAGLLARRPLGLRCALVADAGAHAPHGAPLEEALRGEGVPFDLFLLEGGEGVKTRERKAALEDEMARRGLGRDACVIGFGGGATLDLAGFAAATFARGVPWVAVPTTLLAMVDASVGGKTAVNTPLGKNLVGAFHNPSAVLCDVAYLATLPDRERRSGLAEAAKAALLEGEERVAWMEASAARLAAGDPEGLEETVRFSVAFKARIVEADERESDLRRVLNLGHTVGHAVEAASGFALRHGEAVAIGLLAEALLSEAGGLAAPGLAGRVESLLRSLGLPVRLPAGLAPGAVLPYLPRDKKARGGRPLLVLLREPGRAERSAPVEEAAVLRILETLASGG